MNNSWLDNPWLIQIVGGVIGGLIVGLILQYIVSYSKKRGNKTSNITDLIQGVGYILLAPFFIFSFLLATPLFAILFISESAGACKFTPTCKEYLLEAIKIHGLIGGSILGLNRVIRCNSFTPRGTHDPVPHKHVATQQTKNIEKKS